MRIVLLLLFLATVAGGCAAPGTSSDAVWKRGQCEQIVDREIREKCIERVERGG